MKTPCECFLRAFWPPGRGVKTQKWRFCLNAVHSCFALLGTHLSVCPCVGCVPLMLPRSRFLPWETRTHFHPSFTPAPGMFSFFVWGFAYLLYTTMWVKNTTCTLAILQRTPVHAFHLPWSRCAPWPVPLAHPCTRSARPYTNAYSWGIPPVCVCVKSVFDFVLLFLAESLTRLSTFPATFLCLFRLGLGWYIYVIYAPEISCTPV